MEPDEIQLILEELHVRAAQSFAHQELMGALHMTTFTTSAPHTTLEMSSSTETSPQCTDVAEVFHPKFQTHVLFTFRKTN